MTQTPAFLFATPRAATQAFYLCPMPSAFTAKLLQWHTDNPRPLPWSDGEKDPYRIWLSEIIMQQTRIEQGWKYYLRFTEAFPDIRSLASAPTDDIMRLWQGLGYYTRARNLHKAAQQVVERHQGRFPDNYADIISLPGVGPYSAAAIASFAYALPHAVVDGNVKRVIARYFGIEKSIDAPETHQQIQSITQQHLPVTQPGVFNQAIMNFGALVCKPKSPLCHTCPLSSKCYAYKNNKIATLPLRSKKITNTTRHFHFIVIHNDKKVMLKKREENDIWKGLYSPVMLERNSTRKLPKKIIDECLLDHIGHADYEHTNSSSAELQKLTHQTIIGRFHHINLLDTPKKSSPDVIWVTGETIQHYGKPKMVVDYFESSFPTKINRVAARSSN